MTDARARRPLAGTTRQALSEESVHSHPAAKRDGHIRPVDIVAAALIAVLAAACWYVLLLDLAG